MSSGKRKERPEAKAINAFKISICKIECNKSDKQIAKCIDESGACLKYNVFKALIYNN